jgi:hypothetical protein
MTSTAGAGWEGVASRMLIVNLSLPVVVLIPSLLLYSTPRRTRGISFPPGLTGFAVGMVLVAASLVLGILVGGPLGAEGATLAFWVLCTAGVVMMAGTIRPLAFVKPICTRCRLLPVIKEHEAIHLNGVSCENAVWASMRTRHSVKSLALEGDPTICWFCPIPKRLTGH